MTDGSGLTRRALLGRAAAGGGALALGGIVLQPRAAIARGTSRGSIPRSATPNPISLPSPAEVRRDFTTMVEFGPRLTGSDNHNRYIAWLEQQFVDAGLQLQPCDVYETERWAAETVDLTLLEGTGAGQVKIGAYYPRSQATPPAGVTGPLVYGGAAPAPSVSGTNLAAVDAGIAGYPGQLSSWASGISGTLDGAAEGSILLVDLPLPMPLTAATFLPIATYLNWPGHTITDWATSDYKRLWIEPGLGVPLAPFQSLGARAVVFILDCSYPALAGGYLPFGHGLEPLPALYVDRDTGQRLRTLASARPSTRLTLSASTDKVPAPTVTAVLPGASDEVLVFNTHTDGQGFAEENGGVAFVQLARYFGSLPASQRLKRTLVFAAWPGHMTYDLPQTQGWIDAHPDLVSRAAAALTVEHLGCSEWIDTLDSGYHATGQAEMFGIWTTQGKMFELTRDTVVKHGIPRAALLRPPVQFGVGAAFQSSGVPQIGAIAGPEYLVTISENGDLDKLDEALAARQIAWLADLATELDGVSKAELRQGDPTLGAGNSNGPSAATEQQCTPATAPGAGSGTTPTASGHAAPSRNRRLLTAGNLAVDLAGVGRAGHTVVLDLQATHGSVRHLELQLLQHQRVIAQGKLAHVGTRAHQLTLRTQHGHRIATGTHALVVREGGKVRARRTIQLP
jgi:hypothetical protein